MKDSDMQTPIKENRFNHTAISRYVIPELLGEQYLSVSLLLFSFLNKLTSLYVTTHPIIHLFSAIFAVKSDQAPDVLTSLGQPQVLMHIQKSLPERFLRNLKLS